MASGLIVPHHPRRLTASGRDVDGGRPARSGRPARARAFTIPKPPTTRRLEKPTPDKEDDRTKTDTGRRDEDSQALERTLVKELGKLTP
jgi:hypothetical protein